LQQNIRRTGAVSFSLLQAQQLSAGLDQVAAAAVFTFFQDNLSREGFMDSAV
jgi:hypothetical protein